MPVYRSRTTTHGTQQAISFKLEPKDTICEVSRVGDGTAAIFGLN